MLGLASLVLEHHETTPMTKLINPIIKSNREIADKIYELVVAGDFSNFKPGAFVHIKCSGGFDPLLRRPISICDVRKNELVLLYRAEGRGTSLLSAYNEGDSLDMLAPLGNGFDLNASAPGSTALLIGGGIGVPPLYYLGRLLKERGVIVKTIIGFNQAKDVFYAEEFAELGETYVSIIDTNVSIMRSQPQVQNLHYSTGLVTDLLDKVGSWDQLYSCGPTAMLKALQKNINPEKTAFISLEERMGCGVGACLACVCDLSEPEPGEKAYVRVCTEGPVFPINDIVLR